MRVIPMLDEAAMAAVRQWRFQPTIVDGRAVPARLTVTVSAFDGTVIAGDSG